MQEAYDKVVVPTVEAMAAEGTPFTGILYAGLILTEDGPKVIEFNARFGDPEAQVVLPRMASDFGEFMTALMDSKPFDLKWNDEAMLGVVVAADGYPEDVVKGAALPNLDVFSAQGLRCVSCRNKIMTVDFVGNGGRVILIAAKAFIKRSTRRCIQRLVSLEWDGFFYRTDIGWRTFE